LSTSPPLILSSLSACSPLPRFRFRLLFLFPPPPATATYTLSLHDALPIFVCFRNLQKRVDSAIALFGDREAGGIVLLHKFDDYRSEEHTSELQSRFDLVCRLLLEKKKQEHQNSTHTQNYQDEYSVYIETRC